MMLYKIMLCLVVFGATVGMMNSLQLYPVSSPTDGNKGITEAQVTDMSKNMANAPLNPFSSIFLASMLLNMILSAGLALLTIIPFLTAWGIPLPLAGAIQTPIWFVMGWGLWEMHTGQTPPAQD